MGQHEPVAFSPHLGKHILLCALEVVWMGAMMAVVGLVKHVTIIMMMGAFVALFSPCYADDIETIYRQSDENQAVFKGYNFPAPEDFLSNSSYADYRRHVDAGNCNMAMVEIAIAFNKKHPDAPHPALATGGGLGAWETVVAPKYYPDLYLCRTVKLLTKARQGIAAANVAAPRFPQKRPPNYKFSDLPRPVWIRDIEVTALIRLALNDYGPAYLELAKLSDEGEVLRLTPSYAYYALSRAKRAEVKDPALDELYKKASAAVSENERKRLSQRIESGTWPRTEPLLVD